MGTKMAESPTSCFAVDVWQSLQSRFDIRYVPNIEMGSWIRSDALSLDVYKTIQDRTLLSHGFGARNIVWHKCSEMHHVSEEYRIEPWIGLPPRSRRNT
jgi:hypothetical protein